MAQAKLPPFIVWRDGRPRFVPGPLDRKLGFKGEDLRDPKTLTWLSFEQASAWGAEKNKEIAEARRTGRRAQMPRTPKAKTVSQLLDDWIKACERRVIEGTLSAKTLEGYEKSVEAIKYQPETRAAAAARAERERAAQILGVAPDGRPREPISLTLPQAIGAPELRVFYDYVKDARGHHQAIALVGALSAALTWGKESTAWRLGDNPRIGMVFDRPDGRVMLIALPVFTQIVQASDILGMPSVGHSQYLGLFTGQRQTDRLLLKDKGLIEGRRHLVQSKTGIEIKIKETRQLGTRLETARAQVAAVKLAHGTRPDTIIVDERTGREYSEHTYRHRYDLCRAGAAHGIIQLDGKAVIADPETLGADFAHRLHNRMAWLLPPMPACAEVRDQDLRDTFVILTYRAMVAAGNVNLIAICDVSGHSYSSVDTIVKHYLGRNPELADAALDTLSAFVAKEGFV